MRCNAMRCVLAFLGLQKEADRCTVVVVKCGVNNVGCSGEVPYIRA